VRVVLQRVSRASVSVGGETVGAIGRGVVLLTGIAHGDDAQTVRELARKCAGLRVFPDDDGKFDRSLIDVGGEALVVSQFTLLADTRRGRRPGFTAAAPPDEAARLVEAFAAALRETGVRVATGRFGALMQVELVNDGPATIILDSAELDRPRR
jgi:D-tyrosyl-tRNA(Tyr) deacylase